MRDLLLTLMLATALAGCNVPGLGKDGGPANYTAEGLALVDLDLDATVVELGDGFTGEATVVNNGDAAATDTLQVRLGQSVVASKQITLQAGEFKHVALQFTLARYGLQDVTFSFGETEQDIALRVKAPSIEDITFTYDNLACKAELPFTITFRNAGDGEARDVVVSARVVNTNEVEQDNGTKTVASVAPGKTGKASFTLFAPDVCDQEDYFRVRATITPRGIDAVPFVSDPVMI